MSEPKLRFKADDGSEFPEWETKEISSYLSIRNEKQVPTEEAPLKAFIANIGVADKGDRYDRSFLVKSEDKKYKRTELNDFIYSSNNLDVGSIGLNTYGTAVISDVYEVFKTKENIVPKVLDLAIQRKAVISAILRFRQGCLYGQYKIYPEDFLSVEISVPSFSEQQKIADLIFKLDAILEQTQSEITAWEKQKRGVMQLLFSRKVRFKANDGSEFPEWETYHLSDFTERIIRKNTHGETDIPLTISSQYGLVDQRNYFSKTIAAKDMSGYFLLKKGEFAYNKSSSVGYDYGAIKRLDNYNQGAVSTLYICFSILNNGIVNSDFIAHYFDSNKWDSEAKLICAEGARNHGLLNVSPVDFFNMNVYIPQSLEEQNKIAACLSGFDDVIDKAKKELEAYRELKKGLLQQMFV